MRWLALLVILGTLLGGCGDDVPVRDCAPGEVGAAEKCSDGTVACQGADYRSPVAGCMLRLQESPGVWYEAVCVEACRAPACGP